MANRRKLCRRAGIYLNLNLLTLRLKPTGEILNCGVGKAENCRRALCSV